MRRLFIQPVESGVAVGLQRALEAAQVSLPDARLCDPASKRTTPPEPPDRRPDGHRAHRSTTAPSWSCRCPAPAPEPACRRRAVCPALSTYRSQRFHQRRQRAAGATHPVGQRRAIQFDSFPRVDLRLAGRAGDGPHTSPPAHAPAVPGRPGRGRSGGSAPAPARCARTRCSSASAAPVRITLK